MSNYPQGDTYLIPVWGRRNSDGTITWVIDPSENLPSNWAVREDGTEYDPIGDEAALAARSDVLIAVREALGEQPR